MKKVISGMLALVMVLCIMSVSVMAAEYVLDGGFEGYASNWTAAASTTCNAEQFGVPSSNSMAIDTTIVKTGSQSMKLIAVKAAQATYTLNSNKFAAAAGTYTIKVDVYPTIVYQTKNEGVARVRIGFASKEGSYNYADEDSEADWNSTVKVGGVATTATTVKPDYIEVDVPVNAWTSIEVEHTPSKNLNSSYYNVVVRDGDTTKKTAIGDVAMYVDNFSVTEKAAVVEPSEYNVTINSDVNANIAVTDAVVEAGEATTFTVAPKFGYYIQSITVGGTAIDVLDAYKGGTYNTGEINADTAIVVTIAALADSTIDGVSTDVATLPAVFAPAADTAVTFGKVLDNTATEYGIYLTNAAGEVKTASGVGPYFAADIAKGTANGQFAIEFIGLEAGTYTAKTYVVVGGETTFGIATTFVVAE